MLQKSDPKSRLALLEQQKRSRTISKCLSSLPLLDCSKIYDLLSEVGQAWRRSWIIYQGASLPRSLEQMPDGLNFTDFFFLPSSSNFCLRWTRKVFLQNAQWDVMLIKVIVQWLGTIPSWKKALLSHAPPALQVLRPASSTCLALIFRGSQRRPEWRLIDRGKLESAGYFGPTLCSKDVAISFEYQIRFIHLFSHEDSTRLSENPLSIRTWKHSFG